KAPSLEMRRRIEAVLERVDAADWLNVPGMAKKPGGKWSVFNRPGVERRSDVKHGMPALLLVLGMTVQASAYIAAMPTLAKIITDSSHIVVLQVDKVNREEQVIVFKKAADLKGKGLSDVVKHKLTDGLHPRQSHTTLDWAEPGSIAVSFHNGE